MKIGENIENPTIKLCPGQQWRGFRKIR